MQVFQKKIKKNDVSKKSEKKVKYVIIYLTTGR